MTMALLMVRAVFDFSSFTYFLLFIEVQEIGRYFLSSITYSEGTLTQTVINNGYPDISRLNLETVRIFGAPSVIDTILVNGELHIDFEILPSNEIQVHNLKIPVNSGYTINFTDSNSNDAHSLFTSCILFYVTFFYNLLFFVFQA